LGISLKESGKYVIWPVYLDSTKTRKEGRKIPRRIAVSSPKLPEIEKATSSLGLEPIVNMEAIHPRARVRGYVLVKKGGTKLGLLRDIAKKISEFRESV